MSPKEMTWQAAIMNVLKDAGTAIHYAEIAERVVAGGLRKNVGHTPSKTVYGVLADKKDVFEKVAPATFRLRGTGNPNGVEDDSLPDTEPPGPSWR